MEIRKTKIEGLVELFPRVFNDERGYFMETFQSNFFKANGLPENFVQDNQSFSKAGVLRGLHFQLAPFAQGKLVRVISGVVLDIAVDIRPNSPTFGQYEKFLLSADLKNMAYIPEGFAHGFYTVEDAIFSYKCTNVYSKASEGGLIWNDPQLNIDWGTESPLVSDKDLELPTLAEIQDKL